jgi:hypothetical protein
MEPPMERVTRVILAVLTAFLALTAVAGGIGILAGLNVPPVEYLHGSVFRSFTVPGLALLVIVGGSALFAFILLIRRSRFGVVFAATAGIVIMFFEFVEVLVIGSPAGVARFLQLFYFGLGTVITIVSMVSWFAALTSANAGKRA